MNSIKKRFFVLVLCFAMLFTTSCNYEKNNDNDIIFPIEIQVSYYCEKAHFYRINSDGSVEYTQHDGGCVNLYDLEPKGYDYIEFDECSEKVGQLNNDSTVEIINIVNNLIRNKDLQREGCDTPQVYIYYNNCAYQFFVIPEIKKFYKHLDVLFTFLNNNTSVKLNRKIY